MDRPTRYENRSLMERCITRGLPEVTLPGPYNNNLQIVQTPSYVVLFTEMIHDARVVPMDGRPHHAAEPACVDGRLARPLGRRHAGHRHDEFHRPDELPRARARICISSSASRGSTPTRSNTASRVDDPTTWTRPWTVAYPMVKTEGPIYEFACHEGNYGLRDILSGARWEERHTEEAAKKKP